MIRLPTIRCLSPATDWYAVFLLDTEPWFILDRVVCFGSGRPETYHGSAPTGRWVSSPLDTVEGFVSADGGLEPASECSNFYGYIHRDDLRAAKKTDLENEAKKRVERERKVSERSQEKAA